MTGALQGFVVIAVIVGIGIVVGRLGILGPTATRDLSRLALAVMLPCLLVTLLMEADVGRLFSSMLVVFGLASLVAAGAHVLVARLLWRRAAPETVVGATAASMANAGNIGLPVAAYVLGGAAYAAPAIVLQTALLIPLSIVALELAVGGSRSAPWRVVVRALRDPILVATAVGILLAVLPFDVPDAAIEPVRLVGQASVPVILLAFGMSLAGERPLAAGDRRDTLLASGLKLGLMPAVAWALGVAFALPPDELLAVTVLAAMPTGQNVFALAQRADRGTAIARDAALLTTVAAVPVLLAITALLGG